MPCVSDTQKYVAHAPETKSRGCIYMCTSSRGNFSINARVFKNQIDVLNTYFTLLLCAVEITGGGGLLLMIHSIKIAIKWGCIIWLQCSYAIVKSNNLINKFQDSLWFLYVFILYFFFFTRVVDHDDADKSVIYFSHTLLLRKRAARPLFSKFIPRRL